ncbi:monovalent cation/H+ antiporter complex subunit F [Tateyamaria sp. syn59]|uniref:monovalent cation/H+ antiporter complex subunit F n=1 Tax=Tateyamaria sp. syn59 TaxID=2576942 RepID=UPI0011BEC68D|nr:monovalent cation/H+ antiporter complex subunit F [Tateyamaria sp. syn59]
MILLPYLATFLLLTALVGLIRVMRGPTTADRMLAAQLIGTSTVAILLVIGVATEAPALFDVALVFAILAAISLAAFVATARSGHQP